MAGYEIGVALRTEEFDQVVSFFRDGLGVDPENYFDRSDNLEWDYPPC
jgi:hypothetical protein